MKYIFLFFWAFFFFFFHYAMFSMEDITNPLFYWVVGETIFLMFLYLIYAFYFCNNQNKGLHKLKSNLLFGLVVCVGFMIGMTNSFLNNGLDIYRVEDGRHKWFMDFLVWLGENFGQFTPYVLVMSVLGIFSVFVIKVLFSKKVERNIFENEL